MLSAFSMAFHWTTFAIELLGRVVFNSVLLAVVVNYVTQCEMVMFYVKGLTLRLQEKSADIKTAFKVHRELCLALIQIGQLLYWLTDPWLKSIGVSESNQGKTPATG